LKLLVTGASGLLGRKLVEIGLDAGHEVCSVYNQHPVDLANSIRLDLIDAQEVQKLLFNIGPDVVIHTASITDVDLCERNPTLAMDVNAKGTEIIAEACKELKNFLVYVSTDYVFDGQVGSYREEDKPNPINVYGRSKLVGEQMILNTQSDHCITRTSVIFGCGREYRPNLARWLLEKLSKGQKADVINGQYASPTLNTHLAKMLLEVAERRITGTIHLAGLTRINRYEFAVQLAQEFGFEEELLAPVAPNAANWYAKRPPDSSLNVEKAARLLHIKPCTLQDELRAFKLEG
jgi:dTDP-4-dehydrorhamnose reductase